MSIVRAALITGTSTVELREFPDPTPAPSGVVVDIAFCGICGTDVHAYQSGRPYNPAICGHEWAGTISAVGADVATSPRVTGWSSPPRRPAALRGVPGRPGRSLSGRVPVGHRARRVGPAARRVRPRIAVAAARVVTHRSGSQRRASRPGRADDRRLPRRAGEPPPPRRHRGRPGGRSDRARHAAVGARRPAPARDRASNRTPNAGRWPSTWRDRRRRAGRGSDGTRRASGPTGSAPTSSTSASAGRRPSSRRSICPARRLGVPDRPGRRRRIDHARRRG